MWPARLSSPRMIWPVVAALPLLVAAAPAVKPPAPEAEPVATPLPRPDAKAAETPATGDTAKAATGAKADAKATQPPRDRRCDVCGSDRLVCLVCVPRKTEKKVKKICWGVKCDPVCVPGPSIPCGWQCERDDCGAWSYQVWRPTCAEVIERRVPEKREVTRVIPTWEWRVEERCAACTCGLGAGRDPSCAAGD
jgi:hypothetical protein